MNAKSQISLKFTPILKEVLPISAFSPFKVRGKSQKSLKRVFMRKPYKVIIK